MAVRGLSTHRDTTNVTAVLVTLIRHEVRDPEMSGVSAEVTGDNGGRNAGSPGFLQALTACRLPGQPSPDRSRVQCLSLEMANSPQRGETCTPKDTPLQLYGSAGCCVLRTPRFPSIFPVKASFSHTPRRPRWCLAPRDSPLPVCKLINLYFPH